MYTFSACLPPAHHLKIWFQVPSKHLQLNGRANLAKKERKNNFLRWTLQVLGSRKEGKNKNDRKVLLVGVSLAVGICL